MATARKTSSSRSTAKKSSTGSSSDSKKTTSKQTSAKKATSTPRKRSSAPRAEAPRRKGAQQLEDLAEAVHERIRLQLVGPTAPYDFVGGTIEKVVVDVSGEPYLDHEAAVRGWFLLD